MNFELPNDCQRIAVLYSGGADSTALLYAVASKYPERYIVAVTAGCSYLKHRPHIQFARNMFEALTQHLPEGAINEHIITYHDDRSGHHCSQYMEENRERFDVWVIGQNAAPPSGAVAVDRYGRVWDVRKSCPLASRIFDEPQAEWETWNEHVVYKPLINIDKRGVYYIIKEQGIFEDVLKYSRSCPTCYDDSNIDQFVAHCEECWWCFERRWGLSKEDELAERYNELSKDYETKYVQGDDNPYMYDEHVAAQHWKEANLQGKIVSLGVGSGQDIEILGYPDPKLFRGFDFSEGMLANAKQKFPDYEFWLHDCRVPIRDHHEDADILVAMFGAANYLSLAQLKMQYDRLNCSKAFLVFYNEHYQDGISDEYYRYTKGTLMTLLRPFKPVIKDLWDGSNYYVVWWDEDRNVQ